MTGQTPALNWWMARRDKGRAHAFPIYFERNARPADVHLFAGKCFGLPAGYGYRIEKIAAPPKELVKVGERDGVPFFMQRLAW